VLFRPSHSASFRKNLWNSQVSSAPGDAAVDIEAIKHPKMLSHFAGDLDISDAQVL
jgi:hypothetical protein